MAKCPCGQHERGDMCSSARSNPERRAEIPVWTNEALRRSVEAEGRRLAAQMED